MQFSWLILSGVFVVNMLWLGLIFAAQQLDKKLPRRHLLIPWTSQKFLYMQDFWTMTWGDLIGVPLIWVAFIHLVVYRCLGIWHWLCFLALAVVVTAVFLKMCLSSKHKPDMGFPRLGKVSRIGIIHLPYFGFGVTSAIFCLWFIITGELRGPVLLVGFGGAAFYALCFLGDIKSGNLDPLKRI